MKDGAARGGMDEPDQVAPVIAMLDRRARALPIEAPDLVQDGFQANAMLIGGPEFDLGVRKRGRHRAQQRPYLFLTVGAIVTYTHSSYTRGAGGPVGTEAQSWGSGGGEGACRCARPNGIPCWHAGRFVPR